MHVNLTLDAIYSPDAEFVLHVGLTVACIMTAIVLPAFLYVVLNCSSRRITSFKRHILIHTIVAVLFLVILNMLKPYIFLPLFVIYPVGLLPFYNSTQTLIFVALLIWSTVTLFDLTMAQLLYRFISLRVDERRLTTVLPGYGLLAFSNVVFTFFFVVCIDDATIPSEKVSSFLSYAVPDIHELLEKSSATGILACDSQLTQMMAFTPFLTGLFVGSRVITFGSLMALNIKASKSLANSSNANSLPLYNDMFRTTLLCMFGLFLLCAIPTGLAFVIGFQWGFRRTHLLIIAFLVGMSFYPMYSMIVIVCSVSQYRKLAVKKVMSLVK
uniref:G protein-coupled receptor n=1 Tax=Panagrellus redivivus TaxID=6233 RepID=A0A7E4UWT1_PANRE